MILAACLGIVAGLRTMVAFAAICWAVHTGLLHLPGHALAFLGYGSTTWVFTALAVAEMVTDTLPVTPSRTSPSQFMARVITGGFGGAMLGLPLDRLAAGIAAGVAGAVLGTLGGAAARGRLAGALGRDLPAALIEDAVAIGGAALIVVTLP